jgi:hypothetical protein
MKSEYRNSKQYLNSNIKIQNGIPVLIFEFMILNLFRLPAAGRDLEFRISDLNRKPITFHYERGVKNG